VIVELFTVLKYLLYGCFPIILLLTNQNQGDIKLRNIQDPQVSIFAELCVEFLLLRSFIQGIRPYPRLHVRFRNKLIF
jgi:hypothetical protein